MRDETKLDPVRRRILALIERERADMKSLSLSLGKNNAYLQQFIDRGTPRELREKDARKLASLLHATPQELGVAFESANFPINPLSGVNHPVQPSTSGRFLTGAKDLPILGHVKGGEGGFFIDNGEVAGYVMRPAILEGVSDAYAVEVWDTSMEPALFHGWQVWVHPRKPVKIGDRVVIQLNDGQALIKVLVRRTEKDITVRQYNPAKDFKIAARDVKSIHLAVGNLSVVT